MPWLDEMSHCEENTKHNAQTTDHEIGDSQKVVLTTHDRSCGDEQVLGSSIKLDIED